MTSPTNPILQQLHRLNGSSPDFPQQLEAILRSNEYEQCVPKLQGDDLMWLVDYLDKVSDTGYPFPFSAQPSLGSRSS